MPNDHAWELGRRRALEGRLLRFGEVIDCLMDLGQELGQIGCRDTIATDVGGQDPGREFHGRLIGHRAVPGFHHRAAGLVMALFTPVP